jgi:membrane-bound lytic murein transglycosylase MltF
MMPSAISMMFVRRPSGAWSVFLLLLLVLFASVSVSSCSDSRGSGEDGAESAVSPGDTDQFDSTDQAVISTGPGTEESRDATQELLTSLDEQTPELQFALGEWHGDLDGIISERFRIIRLLTVFEPMHYAIDGRKQGGITYEAAREFEEFLNQELGNTRTLDRIRIILIPVRRDELFPFLSAGRGDIAAANLTITDERLAQVDFSDPFVPDSYEVVVTGPGVEPVESLQDLSGRSVYVRRSSSYYESLERVNQDLEAQGLPLASIVTVNEILDDGAILKLVNEGRLSLTVVDSHIAELWAGLFTDLRWSDDVRPREDTQIAWAVRKDTPQLLGHINAFVKTHKKGTLTGNILINRYLKSTKWLEHLEGDVVIRRMNSLKTLFQEKADLYDLDWRRLAAQAYQESGLDQSRRSSRGAIGLMQLMPATAREMGFPDISTADANVEAGAKYMRHVIDTYLSDVEQNSGVDPEFAREEAYALALAAYNAGPTRISRLRRTAASRGIDSRIWFGEMEPFVAREVGVEPVLYVGNIMKFSIQIQMQQLLYEERQRLRELGVESSDQPGD